MALTRASGPAWARSAASTYIWFFRSLPLLVLLIFVYNMPQIAPGLRPVLSNPFWAGLIALVISETAYLAEIHRGGLLAVDRGQHEAAHALGFGAVPKYRHIIVPQSIRVALPSLGNEFITIVKLTSLVSVISLAEVLLVGQRLYTRNFLVIETMVAVSAYYILIVSIFSFALSRLEGRLDVTRNPGAERTVAPVALAVPDAAKRKVSTSNVLELAEIRKAFGSKEVLKRVSLNVKSGEVVSIIGPSGSGKTTLIRTINALQDIDAGHIRFQDKKWIDTEGGYTLAPDFYNEVTNLGMVFQSFNLFPHALRKGPSAGARRHRRPRRG